MFAYDIPNEIELPAVPNGIPVGKRKDYSSGKFKSLFNASFNTPITTCYKQFTVTFKWLPFCNRIACAAAISNSHQRSVPNSHLVLCMTWSPINSVKPTG